MLFGHSDIHLLLLKRVFPVAQIERFWHAVFAQMVKTQGVVLFIQELLQLYLVEQGVEFSLAELHFENRVVDPHPVLAQKVGEFGSAFIVADVVAYEILH